MSFVHRFERPVLAVEVLLLVCFFTGLYFGGGQKEAAMWAAIGSGFWAQVFWLGVVGIGMLLPQLLALLAPRRCGPKRLSGAGLQPDPGGDPAAALLRALCRSNDCRITV